MNLDWLDAPRADRGVRLAAAGEGWEYRSYADLALAARRVAAALAEDGVRPGDVVCVLLPGGFRLLTALFGAWAAGAVPCLVAPPGFTARDEHTARVDAILAQARPTLTITDERLPVGSPWLLREAATPAPVHPPDGLALLQFTSGSTGAPRGVRVTWANLRANLAMIRDLLDFADGDVTASWLPLHHDMGLIGCLLTPVSAQCDLWLMRPEQFVRDPLRWLRCFTSAQHTAVPPSALDLVTRRVQPAELAALDLSGWRGLIVGAEAIDPAVLERFARLVEPAGFRRSAFRPAYGLAEATLAVTAHRGVLRTLRCTPAGAGEPVRLTGPLLTGCGTAAPGHHVSIVDDDGVELPDGHLGEIAVRGPSVADGYHGGATGGSTRFVDGRLRTGDAGFRHDGDLFVLGRLGDSLKVNGRSVFVEDLENAVAAGTALPRERFTVVAAPGPRVFLLAERAPGEWADQARGLLTALLGPRVEVLVVAGRRGLVARTSSGKPRRRQLAAAVTTGLPAGARVLLEGSVS